MQPLIEHELELAGYETRALELEGEGAPLLLLHGWADSADTWRWVLDGLARADRRALALDMPGFGACTGLRDREPVLEQLDAFGRAALDYLAPGGGAVVCGNSLGGAAALRLSEESGLGLSGIVPIAPAGLEMARWLTLIESEPGLRIVLNAPLPGPAVRAVIGEVYKRLAFRHPDKVDTNAIDAFAGHLAVRGAAARALATGRRLRSELREPFRLERISCPVLLVWGENDLMVFQTGAQDVLDAAPDSGLEVIEDCGHCPQLERPERIVELLLGYPPETSSRGLRRKRPRPNGAARHR